jgi:hypothetical protein
VDSDESLAEQFGQIYGRRREWREFHTQEIAIRTNHNRRKYSTRGAVLAAFALAMIVYPVMGTLTPSPVDYGSQPDRVSHRGVSSVEALVLSEPKMPGAALPLPSIDDTARSIATTTHYVVSSHLPNCSGSTEWEGTNGNLTASSLCTLWDGRNQVRPDAAVALAELNHEYRVKFGENLCIESSYRTYGDQVRVKALRGYKAATPGTSFHGWGLAIDLCRPQYSGESGKWLDENGPAYGWVNPPWASTTKYEPWHYEYEPDTHCFGLYAFNASDGCTGTDATTGSGGGGD